MIQEETIIGPCRLIRGDCLTVMKELPPVDMVFTDPPYGHNNNNGDLIHRWEGALGGFSKKAEGRPILEDGKEANGIFLLALYRIEKLLKAAGCCCCCCGGGPDPQFARWSLWMDAVMKFKQAIVWDKGKIGMGWHYRRSYEMVLVAEKKGTGKARWFDESHKVENIIRPGDYGIKKIIPNKDQHPTLKPVELPEHFINLHTRPGETVLDPFMGSGTTGVAAVRRGRRFIGIELDEAHYRTAVERVTKEWERMEGKEAVPQ